MQPEAIAPEPLHTRPLATPDLEPTHRACQDPLFQKWTVSVPVPCARCDAACFVLEHCPASWPGIGPRILGDGCSEVGSCLARAR